MHKQTRCLNDNHVKQHIDSYEVFLTRSRLLKSSGVDMQVLNSCNSENRPLTHGIFFFPWTPPPPPHKKISGSAHVSDVNERIK